MSKTKIPFLIGAVLVIVFQSCTVAKISGRGPVPLLLNQPTEKMQIVEHIKIKKNIHFDYTSSFDISELLSQEIIYKKPDAVTNTTITIKQGADNFLLNLITLNLAYSRKIIIDADFLKTIESSK